MKKLLIIGLLVGCASSTPQATTTPDPVVAEEVTPDNKYAGVTDFLVALLTLNAETFEELCANEGGNFNTSADYYTCTDGLSGFSIQITAGVTRGSSVLVPAAEGRDLAQALFDELGPPDFSADNAAQWDLESGVVVFGPVGNVAYITIMELTGVTL
jgi:hypothetical protein